jgi:type III restriction enzyme
LLTEQILGRGLRLPFGHRVGVPMLDTVEVVSHHSFRELLKEAKVLLEQTLGDREDVSAVLDPTPGVAGPSIPVEDSPANAADGGLGVVEFHMPGRAPAASDTPTDGQDSLFSEVDLDGWDGDDADSHVGLVIADVQKRLDDAKATETVLAKPLLPRTPGGVKIPLFLPRVVARWVRDPFSLSSINLIDVEALGRKFADDDAPALTRKMLDAERDEDGSVRVRIHDANGEVIAASQQSMPFDTIETDLVARLMRTNGITASVSEANAAVAIAQAFLRGAEVTEETPWRKEHGQLATARLTEWINAKQTSSPAREVKEVTQVKWPEVAERIEALPPADRQVVTNSGDFVRGYPYTGWDRAVYEVNSFDAYSTEFKLAELFEKTNGIKAWVRVNQSVPIRIAYLQGALQREYEPDFIVVDDDGTYWLVEGKSNKDMTDATVLLKRDAAVAWVAAVNASTDVQQKWGYVLASESVIASAGSWAALLAGAQTFA